MRQPIDVLPVALEVRQRFPPVPEYHQLVQETERLKGLADGRDAFRVRVGQQNRKASWAREIGAFHERRRLCLTMGAESANSLAIAAVSHTSEAIQRRRR